MKVIIQKNMVEVDFHVNNTTPREGRKIFEESRCLFQKGLYISLVFTLDTIRRQYIDEDMLAFEEGYKYLYLGSRISKQIKT